MSVALFIGPSLKKSTKAVIEQNDPFLQVYRTIDTDYGGYHETVDGERLWRGKDPAQFAETLEYLETVEPLLREAATLEVVTTVPVGQVADIVVAHCL